MAANFRPLSELRACLDISNDHDTRKQALIELGQTAEGGQHKVQTIIDADMLQPLRDILADTSEDQRQLSKEAQLVMIKLINGGNDQQAIYVGDNGGMNALCLAVYRACRGPREEALKCLNRLLFKIKGVNLEAYVQIMRSHPRIFQTQLGMTASNRHTHCSYIRDIAENLLRLMSEHDDY